MATTEFGDLPERLVAAGRLAHPLNHRIFAGLLVLLVVLCVVATTTRQSPLTLAPVPLYLLGGFGLWQVRRTQEPPRLLGWWVVLLTGTLGGFWLMGFVANVLDR
ncbi:hypothetical protein [Amycolatopsis albispora]|uniref:Transmembrane protein n=1 Tax=Amycolatopsis albispora TaxID=1804986 RepID=A0A344LI42_9PSEU|nr:hypothetical protein [Amycolatopsis albispora]AXB47716.1 hypothetical protein A4R43_39060 [Amycolatopsis albispora]